MNSCIAVLERSSGQCPLIEAGKVEREHDGDAHPLLSG
jgi:hypothetical protein